MIFRQKCKNDEQLCENGTERNFFCTQNDRLMIIFRKVRKFQHIRYQGVC